MPQDNKQLQRLREKLVAACNEIHKLQQKNVLLRQKLALLPSPPATASPPNEYASLPTAHNSSSSTTNKRLHSPNNVASPPSKVSKPRYNTSHHNLTAIAKQFSSPTSVRDDLDPLGPENIRDPEFINAPTHQRVEHAHWAFLQRLGPALRRFKTPLYKIVVRFFLRSGLIDHEYLKSFDLSLPYTFRNERTLDHI
ncbi:hypothetical protein G6F46_011124 [Rhizopus delemar]|uniref:Uncharacterized protein n=2 Tax=Rhizopus TaxID=4842 RepID=A0A9P7CM47_9FUNG|nr:hypothetical protein G6F55_010525 [Rhizopus delemar]KAG1539996.1 hypothetical protein G6F51_008795 [Rhizopus arrhizus]KAG1493735.1 hypothetical protein G6F54_008368 [Rhizopus delemar]KAG1502188.1 hypothetical protein G6F53_010915 [Rhizopus delemar]KAG1516472.1 hypothetical protein G6F52_009439 [Rhizopus delemar]